MEVRIKAPWRCGLLERLPRAPPCQMCSDQYRRPPGRYRRHCRAAPDGFGEIRSVGQAVCVVLLRRDLIAPWSCSAGYRLKNLAGAGVIIVSGRI